MPNKKSGQTFTCKFCGEDFYKQSWSIKGTPRSCKKPECRSASMSGENNPFWGRNHDLDARERIKEGRRANPPKGTGPKKGVFRQTQEARDKISASLRERWKTNRDGMIASLPRGETHPLQKLPHERRHRVNFTPLQRREWKDTKCFWCSSTENLALDHVIPVMAGGTKIRENAQTLCRPCNLWKMKYVDRPYYFAALGSQRGQN